MRENTSGDAALPAGVVSFNIDGAVRATGFGRSKLWEAISAGSLLARHNGARIVIEAAELARWVAAQPRYQPGQRLRVNPAMKSRPQAEVRAA